MTANQNPEQIVRDEIDKTLLASGWHVQSKKQINLAVSVGVTVREYQTNVGPADYILFVNKKPVGVIEAKHEEEGILELYGITRLTSSFIPFIAFLSKIQVGIKRSIQ